jgi:phosphoribosyl 1,2-cyclic phosphodiesterase
MIFCPLFSGSSGNSIFVASNSAKILIDAGMPGKSIDSALKEIGEKGEELDGIFITHEHSDHIKGVGIFSRKYNIPIYANELTWKSMMGSIGKIKEENIMVMNKSHVTLKDMDIFAFPIPHDAAAPRGYSVTANGKKACVATDLGHFTDDVKEAIIDGDIILLECNHDIDMLKVGPYPYSLKRRILSDIGHLSNEACGEAILTMQNGNQKKIILGHLSQTNNHPDLAYQTVFNILQGDGVDLEKEIAITMAKRNMPSNYIKVV